MLLASTIAAVATSLAAASAGHAQAPPPPPGEKAETLIRAAIAADPAHYTVEFESAEVRVLRMRYGPHEKGNMQDHPRSVTVFLTDGHLRMTVPGRAPMEATVKAGSVVREDAGPHQPENLSDQPFEAVRTEFKTPESRTTPRRSLP